MKIIVTSIGTRGDMEPFLAIGEILKEKGHEVICLFPEQFRNLAEDSGFEFESLGEEFIEMLHSPAGKAVMGGGKFGWKKIRAFANLVSVQKDVNKQMIIKQEAVIEKVKPDRIVHNGKVMYPVVWATQNKGKTVFVSPVPYLHYVKNHAHIAFNKNYGPLINKVTYQLANFGLLKTISGSVKWLNTTRKIKHKEIQKALFSNKVIYTISPSLFKRPDYWKNNLKVLGYHERKKTLHWQASSELEDFIHRHSKIVFITFGSMVNTNPTEKTQIMLDILERNNIPAIINTASGGLEKPTNYPSDLVHFVDQIPYDWIFPKMHAVIHHGGSGTTHTAIKYGCASLIIPHIIDQYVWNKILFKKGVGPLGLDVRDITTKSLEPKILDLINNPSYKSKAEQLENQMQSENLRKEIYQAIVNESTWELQ